MATDVPMEDVIGLDDTQRDSSGEAEHLQEAGETESLAGRNGRGKNGESSNEDLVGGPTAIVQKDEEKKLGAYENKKEERGIHDIGADNEADIGGDGAQEEQKAGADGRDADIGDAKMEHGNEEANGGAEEPAQEEEDPMQKAEITLPLARINRIVKLDPDIKQVSADALKTIALATELFLGSLAVSTAHVTRAGKRSMVKVEDLLQTVKSRRRYRECLGTDLEHLRSVDENRVAGQEARQAKKLEKAARQVPPGVNPITNFFKK